MLRVFLTILFLSSFDADDAYHGPKSLGPFVIDNYDFPMKALFDLLGAPRNPKSEIICYESMDRHFFIWIERLAGTPRSAGTVLISDFRNCFGQPKNSMLGDPKEWKTEKGVGLGSTTTEIERAYGKPSAVDKDDSESGKGIFYGDSVPVGARPEVGRLQWRYRGASDDLRATIFGIRNSKVAWILITHNE
jgi:hypothetical protein